MEDNSAGTGDSNGPRIALPFPGAVSAAQVSRWRHRYRGGSSLTEPACQTTDICNQHPSASLAPMPLSTPSLLAPTPNVVWLLMPVHVLPPAFPSPSPSLLLLLSSSASTRNVMLCRTTFDDEKIPCVQQQLQRLCPTQRRSQCFVQPCATPIRI